MNNQDNSKQMILLDLVINGDLTSLLQTEENDKQQEQEQELLLSTFRDKNGSNLLHYAAGYGHLHICKFLLEQSIVTNVNESNTKNERTPLHFAARNGHIDVCKLLVMQYGANVDAQAKGQVTPLQLSIWQCHLQLSQCLVEELGANVQFVNSWGCSVAHWMGKCPIYKDYYYYCEKEQPNNNKNHAILSRLQATCDWLFQTCHIKYDIPNHHGQTPLHKAAYAGNLFFIQYLYENFGVLDSVRDNNGNNAADCAERSKQYEVAKWIRRYVSTEVHQALHTLGFYHYQHHYHYHQQQQQQQPPPSPPSQQTIVMTTLSPPTLQEIRLAYLKLAKLYHPDKRLEDQEEKQTKIQNNTWNSIVNAYQLLQSWWWSSSSLAAVAAGNNDDNDNDDETTNNPELFDCQIRMLSRNAQLLEYPLLKWMESWHYGQEQEEEEQQQQKQMNPKDKRSRSDLADFEFRLVRLLLSNDQFRKQGLPMSQLRKEFEKNWPDTKLPEPKDYGCKKLISLFQQHFPNITVERRDATKQQPLLKVNVQVQ